MPMYNLIEYSDNYADSSGSLYQFKRDESPMNNAENPNNVALDNSSYFKYKASILGKAADADGHLELNWNNNCAMYGDDTYADGDNANDRETTFKIISTKLYALIVTLPTKDNVYLTRQLNKEFKRSVYWNEYKSK